MKSLEPIIHLMSGGLDSTVLLFDLKAQGHPVHCLLFDYGQVHGKRELPIAGWFCGIVGVQFTKLVLPSMPGSSLTDGNGSKVVPNRNAILLSVAIGVAMNAKVQRVTCACNKDDAADFPDCRREFIDAMNAASKAAGTGVEVCAPYLDLTKREIVGIGKYRGVPMSETWSCYRDGVQPCGECDACKRRAEAMA